VGLIAITVAKIADEMVDFGKRRMRGLTQLNEEGHLVILGYCQGETETLVSELLHDETEQGRSIVLCAEQLEENPMPDRVKYVRGDLSSDDVLERACIAKAARILVHCSDDNETLVVTLAARSVNRTAHVVARVQKEASQLHLRRIDPQIECVRSLSIPLMVHAVQDRGTTAVISSLLSHRSDDTVFRMQLPENGRNWTFGALQRAFKEKMDVTVVGVAGPDGLSGLNVNPASAEAVPTGASLFYLAAKRVDGAKVSWDDL
jgi:voltage-gated potassium channel